LSVKKLVNQKQERKHNLVSVNRMAVSTEKV
jgi:hypothetical protein